MASVNLLVTVHVDTAQAQKQLRLLRFHLWLSGLWPRLKRWLADLVPVRRGALRMAVAERDEARAVAAFMHQAYWRLLATRHIEQLTGKN